MGAHGKVTKINKAGKMLTRRAKGQRVAFSVSKSSSNPDRKLPDGKKPGHYRTKSTINRINMYKSKPGQKELEERKKTPTEPCRIAPDRRWFGNTRVVTQKKMQTFREELSKSVDDPFSVVIKASKLPMSLLKDPEKEARMNLLKIEPYENTFGKKAQRKRPNLKNYDMNALAEGAEKAFDDYDQTKDSQLHETLLEKQRAGIKVMKSQEVFKKGTSRRIWAELYKVIDSSDVVLQIVDARDPMGTRSLRLEREIKKKWPHKHVVLILNKCDLIPTWATKRWVKILSKEYPTLAFHASITNPFGKGALLQLLRQFSGLLSDRKHVSVGLVGFPNAGKSSVINALKRKNVCKAAPVPGETRIWQFVSLTKRIFLIDCPGVVPQCSGDFEHDQNKLLRGVVRAEKVDQPSQYIDGMLSRIKKEYIIKRYKFPEDAKWDDAEDFLSQLATKMGKLLKGGNPDIETAARVCIYDWQRGRIPYFEVPPFLEKKDDEESEDERQTPENNSTVAAVLNSIDQDFGDLACDHDFDETDMKGDKQAIKDAKEEKKASKAASSSDQPASKKRKADKIAQDILKKADELENKADGKIGEEKGANAENQPEKKKKKARRGKKGLGKVKQLHTVPLSSSVDWAKCTNEFDC